MKKIKRPSWPHKYSKTVVSLESFNNWFDHFVEPYNKLIEGAVEVKSYGTQTLWRNESVTQKYLNGVEYVPVLETHRAYLIGIEPIKEETAEDVLREILDNTVVGDMDSYTDLCKRAKAVLGG